MNFSADPSNFVLLTDVVPDVLLDIRYYSTFNFVGARVDGYEEPVAILTREAAEALRQVGAEAMRRGYRLKIFDCYRPQMAVDHFVCWAEDIADTRTKEYFYPDVDKRRLFELDFIAKRSGHSRGSTVDLTLFDMRTQRDIDTGGTFDFFGDISHSDRTEGLTAEQRANRALLRGMMLSHGFRPIDSEWWHFTLADEPYPDTYFTFPVRSDMVRHG